ncbi:hypothetical protein Pyn_28240 [Prunus yedoensis var. nudiflora]|uniref:Uncharacterized protein n=1 Tax=Prunus yedoensis var. nudiflora TaxID=2094558 RepID=A0A314Y278_PRUYE|nr:hypothetical protein Pyn_35859 [Prunus yedoensis var. nudiflora]PQQ09704.1 hypothetical protein Pyn_28240 [Prunus yedoensis var. nudiflora]
MMLNVELSEKRLLKNGKPTIRALGIATIERDLRDDLDQTRITNIISGLSRNAMKCSQRCNDTRENQLAMGHEAFPEPAAIRLSRRKRSIRMKNPN